MIPRPAYRLPEDKKAKLARAVRLEWLSIFFLLSIAVVMYFAMGSSQAMKTAWIEDVLSLIPPVAFLVAVRYRDKDPNKQFPYGYQRAPLLSFFVAAVAILVLALYMLYDSAASLLSSHHPTIGHFSLFGTGIELWAGWVMIAALVYSMIPPVILGRMKLPLAHSLREKTLFADATMNKADWMTAGAAIVGILGVGLGYWWADSVAAAFIALDVAKDGIVNLRRAIAALVDQRPTNVECSRPLGLEATLCDEIDRFDAVAESAVRLREEGQAVSGEAFVVLVRPPSPAILGKIADRVREMDWRIHEVVVVPVETLPRADLRG